MKQTESSSDHGSSQQEKTLKLSAPPAEVLIEPAYNEMGDSGAVDVAVKPHVDTPLDDVLDAALDASPDVSPDASLDQPSGVSELPTHSGMETEDQVDPEHVHAIQTTLSFKVIPEASRKHIELPSAPCDLESYTITGLHAEGGTARIYRAFESHSKRPVAIKILRRRFHYDDVISSLFRRHHKALQSLELPHFANVTDSGDSPWGPWGALEWVPGRDLRALIDEGAHWSSQRLFRLMLQLCEALEQLHQRGVTHGDLSARNVIYSEAVEARSEEQLTLIDISLPMRLNLAHDMARLEALDAAETHEDTERDLSHMVSSRKHTEERMSNEISVFGQPVYLAPECLRGDPANARSDLYSLGVLFFELTTGTLPFSGSIPRIINAVLNQEAPAPSIHQKPWPYPIALDALISNLLSKRPEDRCASVSEVKRQLFNMSRDSLNESHTQVTDEFQRAHLALDTDSLDVDDLSAVAASSSANSSVNSSVNSSSVLFEEYPTPPNTLNSPPTTPPPTIKPAPRTRAPLYRPLRSARKIAPDRKLYPSWLVNVVWLLIGMITSWLVLSLLSRY